jgi:Mg-chelatase subunit ChlD
MTYVDMVSGPAPSINGRVLRWTLTDVPFSGLRLAYEVEPTERGRHVTNVAAEAEFVDGLARPGRLRFPVPEVEVVDLDPTATPTLTPVPTQTPTPRPVYLPITVRQQCSSALIGTDVVIVMDNSGSMAAPVSEGGPSQLRAAVAAAGQLVERMRDGDRAALVAFNAEARLVQGLTGDRDLLLQQLDGLQTEAGTRIDLGLAAAHAELSSERAIEGNTLAVVLLTDGRSDVDDADVLEAADTLRALPVRLFVIGLGLPENLDVELLQQVAGREEDFFAAPSALELATIYASIAKTIECANLRWP